MVIENDKPRFVSTDWPAGPFVDPGWWTLRVLQARLLAVRQAEQRAEMDALKGDTSASWGNQMRSYVLHPYQMVKDLRTEYEVGNPQSVFDGDIDGFLEAGIRWRRGADKVEAGWVWGEKKDPVALTVVQNPPELIDDDAELGAPLAAYFRRFELSLEQATAEALAVSVAA